MLFIICCAVALGAAGCGTVRTMPTLGSYGTPQIYSGARLDLDAIRMTPDCAVLANVPALLGSCLRYNQDELCWVFFNGMKEDDRRRPV